MFGRKSGQPAYKLASLAPSSERALIDFMITYKRELASQHHIKRKDSSSSCTDYLNWIFFVPACLGLIYIASSLASTGYILFRGKKTPAKPDELFRQPSVVACDYIAQNVSKAVNTTAIFQRTNCHANSTPIAIFAISLALILLALTYVCVRCFCPRTPKENVSVVYGLEGTLHAQETTLVLYMKSLLEKLKEIAEKTRNESDNEFKKLIDDFLAASDVDERHESLHQLLICLNADIGSHRNGQSGTIQLNWDEIKNIDTYTTRQVTSGYTVHSPLLGTP